MNAKFSKDHDVLCELGLPARLVMLYGKLEFMAGQNGECWPRHSVLAKKIGLRRRQVVNLLKLLRHLKLIEWRRSGPYSNRYRVLKPDVQWIAHLMRNGLHISDVQRVAHRKESSSKRTNEKNPPYPRFPTAGADAANPSVAAEPRTNANASSNPSKPFDDDELNQTPEKRFTARLLQRHGAAFDAKACVQDVHRQLEKCTGLTLTDFLPFDNLNTTGNNFTNPRGYYVDLAKKFAKQSMREARDKIYRVQPPAPDIERDAKGNCAKCGGPGQFPDGSFCDCPTGLDLFRLAKRKPSEPTRRRTAS